MAEDRTIEREYGDLLPLFHRLNNQLGVILAHAELLEAKAPDDAHRARASRMVGAVLDAMTVTHALRQLHRSTTPPCLDDARDALSLGRPAGAGV